MTTDPTSVEGLAVAPTDPALLAEQMARLPHTFPLCRCGEDHHSEAFSAGWNARGEADAARAEGAGALDVDRLREALHECPRPAPVCYHDDGPWGTGWFQCEQDARTVAAYLAAHPTPAPERVETMACDAQHDPVTMAECPYCGWEPEHVEQANEGERLSDAFARAAPTPPERTAGLVEALE